MKAILMAAGIGSRMGQAVSGPKCVLDVAGIPLVRRTVSMLLDHHIEVAVVVGYKREMVVQSLKGLNVHYYFNPFYKVTNSMASLWFARDFIDCTDDIILGNADVYWDEDILDLIVSEERDAVMLADASRADKGDFFLKTEDDRIIAYGKDLKRENRNCEYVGLAKIRTSFLGGFRTRINRCVEDNEIYTLWWENVLYNYAQEFPVYVLDVGNRFWGEIDYIEDYARILEHVHLSQRLKGEN